MTRWMESDRGMLVTLAIAALVCCSILAVIWSWFGTLAVLVPVGCMGLFVGWIGSWMHAAPASNADDTGPGTRP